MHYVWLVNSIMNDIFVEAYSIMTNEKIGYIVKVIEEAVRK